MKNEEHIHPSYILHIERIINLSEFDKLRLYMDYYINRLSLKYEADVNDTRSKEVVFRSLFNTKYKIVKKYKYNRTPDKEIGNFEFNYLWKDCYIKSFEEYSDIDSNIVVTDNGPKWKETNFAQRYKVDLFGIFEIKI